MKHLLAVALAATLTGSAAVAAPITFFGENLTPGNTVAGAPLSARNNFLAALTAGVSTEDMEGLTTPGNFALAPFTLNFSGGLGLITAALNQGFALGFPSSAGRFATSGDIYIETSPGFDVKFDTPVAAFGFYATDIGDFGGQLTIELYIGEMLLNSFVVPHTIGTDGSTNGALLFWGVIDTVDVFDRVRFINSDTEDYFGFDDMTVGDVAQVAVPEPASIALVGTGIGLLGFARRRKRAA